MEEGEAANEPDSNEAVNNENDGDDIPGHGAPNSSRYPDYVYPRKHKHVYAQHR